MPPSLRSSRSRSLGHFKRTSGPHASAAATPAARLSSREGARTNETSSDVPGVMMLIALGAFGLLTAAGIASFDGRSLIALLVVLVAAAISGVVFSWKRYSRRS